MPSACACGGGCPRCATATGVRAALAEPGRPLDPGAREFMESRFAADFNGVRVHTSPLAAESARAVNAVAYTLGRDIVFGSGQYAPETDAGRALLAHELAHTLQRPQRIARQATEREDKPKPPGPTLPPRKPSPAPAPRSTDVPLGVTPCLTGKICEPPVRGSAWDFGKKAEKESTPRPKTSTPAKEVKKAVESLSPGVLKEIFEVTVNPGLSENVAAQVDTCKEFNVSSPDPSASCMEVPKDLEQEAALFNQGKDCMDLHPSADDPLACWPPRAFWAQILVETMTHEAAHIAFGRRTPVGISSRTSNEITLHELSEIYAQFSEFPVHYRMVQGLVPRYKDPQEGQKVLVTSIKAWVKQHVESEGEGIQGMLTKLRCINECDKVTALITSLVESVTATWPDEMKNALLQNLSDADKLDWPLPAPALGPAAPAHPKMPPLYQPRRTFIPEIEKSVEDLP